MTIIDRLRSAGRSEHLWDLIRAQGAVLMIASLWVLLCSAVELAAHGSTTFRSILFWMSAVGIPALEVVAVAPPFAAYFGIIRKVNINTIAIRVGNAYPDVRDTLANALQLQSQQGSRGTWELVDAALAETQAAARDKDFFVIVDKRPGKRFALFALLSLIVAAVSLASIQPLADAADRIVQYEVSFLPPAPFRLVISPERDTVMRGTTTSIRVVAVGTPPSEIMLWLKEGQAGRYTSFPVRLDTSSTYTHILPGMSVSTSFYAEASWIGTEVRSDTGIIVLIDRPILRTLSGRVLPPAYTRMPPAELTERQADITALRGSVAEITVTSSKPLRQAQLVVVRGSDSGAADTSRARMTVGGSSASVRFGIVANGSYYIELEDTEGQTNAEPAKYGIVMLTDGYPTIAMIEPKKNIDVNATFLVPITVSVSDDYGFSGLKLYYRLARSRYAPEGKSFTSIIIPLPSGETSQEVNYVWNVSDINITPEDEYEFYLEISDNDVVSGPKKARTSSLKLRLPSLDEVFAEAENTQSDIQNELKKMLEESKRVSKEAEELQREMQKLQSQSQKQTDWADKKKAEELAQRQQELEKRMEKAVEKLEEMTDNLQQNRAISEETLKRYMELQKLMKEVKSKDLDRMQEQMRRAMEQVSPEELERMMKEFKFDEAKFRQNIERTINLLKRAQAEQKAEELSKRAEELAAKQDELRKQTENANERDQKQKEQLAKQQRQLQDELSQLEKETKDLEQLMKDVGADMPMEQMQQSMNELSAEQTAQAMKDAEQNMQNGEMSEATKQQQQASENLQRFAQQMNQLKRQMRKNSQREAIKNMQKGMNDLLQLSKEQEELMQRMKNLDPSSASYAQMAKQQQRMQESMQNLANSMMQLGQRSASVTPDMAQDLGDALQAMKEALGNMQDRNGPMASREQGSAMSSMNSAVQRMSNALGQMMQGEGQGQGGQGDNPGQGEGQGMSPFQRLQNLAEQQQGINQGMQQMGQNGQNLSDKQRAEMGRLAQQQGKALKALEELERERENIGGNQSRKPIGDLKAIAEEMKEVMSDMQTGSITPETRMRQERILSRLLNASRSINERDYEKTRESRSGTDATRKSPGALDLDAKTARSLRETMDELRRGYTKDYENLIRRYFEALEKMKHDE